MTRILLIIIMVTQLGCASVFWQTIGGTVIGNISAEVIMEEVINKDDEKEKPPEK
jgi:uncharacterized protein YceK